MNGARQAADWVRRAISLALILLFGPAPLISLLAQPAVDECQMTCCKRKVVAQSCPLHHSPADESSALGFHSGPNCPTGCSQAAGAPAAFAAGFVLRSTGFSVPRIETVILAARASGVRWIIDSFLYQRPPPSVFA